MDSFSFDQFIQFIDGLINAHEIESANKALNKLDAKSIPSRSRGELASFARRCGNLKLALKILQPNIFGVGKPTADDLIEYASSVRRLGLINQALLILERAPDSSKKNLNKAFCEIHNWNYKEAQVELENYLKDPQLGLKEQLIGKINLLSCIIENKEYDRALYFLNQFEGECERHSPHLLLNCQETRGQILIKTDKHREAVDVLKKAQVIASRQQHHTSLFIDKWLLVSRLQLGELEKNSEEVLTFKNNVRRLSLWEVLRDFDWQSAKVFNDQEQMKRVYFGTPYGSFKRNMELEMGTHFFESYLIKEYKNIGRKEKIFDPYSDHATKSYGQNIHRLLMILLSDHYSPFSVVRVFNYLFPQDYFDPISSSKRVYRSLEQLKQHIECQNIPLDLTSTLSGYRLRLREGGQIKIHKKLTFGSREEFLAHVLKNNGTTNLFRVKEACEVIPLSQHQWYRAFKAMEDQGFLQESSQGSSFYSLT